MSEIAGRCSCPQIRKLKPFKPLNRTGNWGKTIIMSIPDPTKRFLVTTLGLEQYYLKIPQKNIRKEDASGKRRRRATLKDFDHDKESLFRQNQRFQSWMTGVTRHSAASESTVVVEGGIDHRTLIKYEKIRVNTILKRRKICIGCDLVDTYKRPFPPHRYNPVVVGVEEEITSKLLSSRLIEVMGKKNAVNRIKRRRSSTEFYSNYFEASVR